MLCFDRARPTFLYFEGSHDSKPPLQGLLGRGCGSPPAGDRLRAGPLPPRSPRVSLWLGRYRWVVERTCAWLLGCRRLGVRYERRSDLLQGLLRA